MKHRVTALVLCLCLGRFEARATGQRINQEGRLLGALPVVTNSILFDTNLADVVTSAMQIFPVTNPWNECISNRPVLANSDAMIAQIMTDLGGGRQTLRAFFEMNFALVPDNQPLVPMKFVDYPGDSDLNGGTFPSGLYPIPTNMPIEGWPADSTNTLSEWQQDTYEIGGDRHSIVAQPGAGLSFETWQAKLTNGNWQASNGAEFDLNSNALRPDGKTSGDAAGFPMFQALPRFDECERGMVEHAMRIVVKRSLYNNYIYPATHYASYSTNTSPNLPSMGQRVRLKAAFNIPANWTKEEKAILLALKKYGAMVADNGGFFSISVTPDDRWPSGCFDHLSTVGITNFEVIQTTGANEGPRSPGAPVAFAGADQSVALGAQAQLQGVVVYTNTAPVIRWKAYSGPGTVTFGNASLTNTTAGFSAPGVYTLELSANDSVHAVAYDAVTITVGQAMILAASAAGTNLNLSWSGGTPICMVEQSPTLPATNWTEIRTTSVQNASLPILASNAFFRVRDD